jgi:hypothetical protein
VVIYSVCKGRRPFLRCEWRNFIAELDLASCRCNCSRCLCTAVSACLGARGHRSACNATTAQCARWQQCGHTAASTDMAAITVTAAACTCRPRPAALLRSRRGIFSCAAAAAAAAAGCRASSGGAVASKHYSSGAAAAATSRRRRTGISRQRAPCSAAMPLVWGAKAGTPTGRPKGLHSQGAKCHFSKRHQAAAPHTSGK